MTTILPKDKPKYSRKKYLILSSILFGIEVVIALFFKDSFIRPLVGDYLVAILLYCLARTLVSSWNTNQAAIAVLLFAYLVEFLQWLNLLKLLGLKRNLFTDLLLGSTFDWGDILAYTLGIITVLILEKIAAR